MFTQDDIKSIIEAQKEIFPTKEEFDGFKEEMRKDFPNLLTAKAGVNLKA